MLRSVKMTTPSVRWITLADILVEVSPLEVSEYLQSKYPDERVLVEGFLAAFAELLPELLLRVFLDPLLLSLLVRTNRAMAERYSQDFLRIAGARDISREEIIAELDRGGTLSFSETLGTDPVFSFCFKCRLSHTLPDEFSSSSEDSSEDLGTLYEVTEIESCGAEDGDSVVSGYDDDYQKSSGGVSEDLDLFSEYSLLRQRYSCVNIDPCYGHSRLKARYDSEVAPDLPQVLEERDVRRAYVVCWIACRDEEADERVGRSPLLEETFPLARQEEIGSIILPVFALCREMIRLEVTRLTSGR